MKFSALTIILVVACNICFSTASFNRFCYFTNWSQFKTKGADFKPEYIDPQLCSHIIYAFAKIESNTLKPAHENDLKIDDSPGDYEKINGLKKYNPSLKTLLSVGGPSAGSYAFDQVTKTESSLKQFSSSIVHILSKWNFDGFDLNWQYPINRKEKFTKLVKALREEFDLNAKETGKQYLLSIDVSANQAIIEYSYDIKEISRLADFVNLNSYNFQAGANLNETSLHSPLFPKSYERNWKKTFNVDWSVSYWLNHGCPKEKLNLGISFYGKGYSLAKADQNQVGSLVRGPSAPGKFTHEPGRLSYSEICLLVKNGNAIEKFEPEQKVPIVQVGSDWISFENKLSLMYKAEYIKSRCLGGFVVWSLDYDDFLGQFCQQSTYPLLTVLNEVLKDKECANINKYGFYGSQGIISPTTPSSSNTAVYKLNMATKTNEVALKCTKTEIIVNLNDCRSFHVCLLGFSEPVVTIKCPNNYWFDSSIGTCISRMPSYCGTGNTVQTSRLYTITKSTTKRYRSSYKVSRSPAILPFTSSFIPKTPSLFTKSSTSFQETTNKQVFNKQSTKINLLISFECPKPDGIFINPSSADSFYQCSNNNSYLVKCPSGLIFNESKQICDF